MKKHIKLLTIGTLLLGGLTGCNDFLDREPLETDFYAKRKNH